MPDERDDTPTTDSKPTITIAEKQGAAAAPAEAQPTITIAEKEEEDE